METIEIQLQFEYNGISYNTILKIISHEGMIQNATLVQIHKKGGEDDEPSEV